MFVIISAQFLPQIINDDDRKLSCPISFYGNAGLASLFEVNWPRRMFDWRLQCQDYMQGESRASQSSGVNTVHCSALLAAPLWRNLGNIFTRTNNTIYLAQQTPQATPPSPTNLNFLNNTPMVHSHSNPFFNTKYQKYYRPLLKGNTFIPFDKVLE